MHKISKDTEQVHSSAVTIIREFKLLDKEKSLAKNVEFWTVEVSSINAKIIF